MEGTSSTDQSLDQIRPNARHEQGHNGPIADPEQPCWAANHLLKKMDHIKSHQFKAVRAVRIWRVAVTAPFRQEDVEMGRQRRQIGSKRPRVNANPAGMEQNEWLTHALFVVPGTNSIQLNICCHSDFFLFYFYVILSLWFSKG
jgi:hypothetical protein